MSKVRDISNLSNVIRTDASGNVSFVSGSTTLATLNTSGQLSGSSPVLSSSYAVNATLHNGTASAQFAVTSSNTFTGQQYISNTVVPVNFTDTASLYTDGGLRATKNAYFSSSLYVNGDLIIFGSQSVNYITSSQLNIADNIITVNTSTPALRFGGIAVIDSGSLANGLTGSLLWDSQTNNWLYSNPSGSGNYDSALVMMGPQNSGALGTEVGLTLNAIPKGAGGHHMTSSAMFEVSGSVGIGITSITAWNGNQGTIVSQYSSGNTNTIYSLQTSASSIDTGGVFEAYSTNTTAGSKALGSIAFLRENTSTTALNSYTGFYTNNAGTVAEKMRITSAGYVGIGTTSPSYTFDVSSSVAANFVSRILNSSSTGYGLYVQTNDNTKPGIRIANASGATAIDLFGSGTTTITGAPSLGNAHVICLSNSSGNTSYGGLEVQSSTGKAGYLTVGDNSNTGWYGAQASYVTLAGTAGAGMKFRVNADDTTGITIPTSGNVGISTSSPAQKLDVNGFIKNNGSYTGFGYVSANNGTAVTLFSTSANFGLYLVGADVPAGTGDINNYSAYAIIYNDGTTSKIMQQTNGGRFTISLSGNNVQGTQTSGGGPYNIRYVYQLLTGT
jgi:hypothetical protein